MLFKIRLRNFFIALVGVYVLLVCAHFTYSYLTNRGESYRLVTWFEFSSGKKNYASEKMDKASAGRLPQTLKSSEIKYEKTASFRSVTKTFDQEEKKLRSLIDAHKAIIQEEDSRGTAGYRQLLLVIGVAPEKFDDFYQALKSVGDVQDVTVRKVDKTNDFLQLKAKRASLESTRQSLIELKLKNGSIEDLVNLQNRILQVEQDLQSLGVSLGEFDEVNEFCTVQFALGEQQVAVQKTSLMRRAMAAMIWATGVYFGLLFFLFGTLSVAFLALIVIDKLRLVQKLLTKLEQ